jgi:hypothetical protein
MQKTLYEQWNDGEIRGFGSFQTTMLQAYRLADAGNRAILETAYPRWFTNDTFRMHEPTRDRIAEAIGDAEFETVNITSEVMEFIQNIKS